MIVLVGFMGAGKTTVGREVAAKLGWRFEDLDDLIQAREGLTIEQIFEQRGEPAFRELERRLLREVIRSAGDSPLVLALGGGAFIHLENQDLLRKKLVPTVFLDAPFEKLFERCDQPEVIRPLRRDPTQFRALYQARRPAYLKAQACIQTSEKTVAAVADEIISTMKLTPISGVTE